MDYKKIAQELLEKIKSYRTDNEGWKVAKESKDATVSWKQSVDWKGIIYKTEGVIDAPPDAVFHYINPLTPDSPRSKWDDSVKERSILEKLDTNMTITRTLIRSALGGLISHREFIDLLVINITDEHFSTNARSVEYDKAVADPICVRGTNYPSAIVCSRIPGEPNKTRLTKYIQTDVGGMIPQSVTDQALPSSQIEFFISLKKALVDGGH